MTNISCIIFTTQTEIEQHEKEDDYLYSASSSSN